MAEEVKMSYLIEGLKEGDLKDLILPIISLDEYESKVDDDAIVAGFYVLYRDPAKDLNRFIQKSATYILDTDTSPAPTEEGYYMVFLELPRNDTFPEALIEILGTLKGLTDIEHWSFKTLDTEEDFEVSEESLKEKIRLEPEENNDDEEDKKEREKDKDSDKKDDSKEKKKKNSKKESVDLVNFFKSCVADHFLFEGDNIIFKKFNYELPLEIIGFGSATALKKEFSELREAVRLDETSQNINSRIQSMLGSHWLIEVLSQLIILSRPDTDNIAIVRLI
jgi:hypothetical protein